MDVTEHQRNLSACRNGEDSCDNAKLTQAEATALALTEHKRNYQACLQGYGYCDPSLLTAAEASRIPAESAPTPR